MWCFFNFWRIFRSLKIKVIYRPKWFSWRHQGKVGLLSLGRRAADYGAGGPPCRLSTLNLTKLWCPILCVERAFVLALRSKGWERIRPKVSLFHVKPISAVATLPPKFRRFHQSPLDWVSGRVCCIHIQRFPSSR